MQIVNKANIAFGQNRKTVTKELVRAMHDKPHSTEAASNRALTNLLARDNENPEKTRETFTHSELVSKLIMSPKHQETFTEIRKRWANALGIFPH
jgi:hypothetical protein